MFAAVLMISSLDFPSTSCSKKNRAGVLSDMQDDECVVDGLKFDVLSDGKLRHVENLYIRIKC